MQDITLKLEGMKKPQSFTIYPVESLHKYFTIQSDKRIAYIEMETGKGLLSKQHQNGAYFVHLNRIFGAYEIQLTPDQLTELKLTAIGQGTTINVNNVLFADNSGISNIKL